MRRHYAHEHLCTKSADVQGWGNPLLDLPPDGARCAEVSVFNHGKKSDI